MAPWPAGSGATGPWLAGPAVAGAWVWAGAWVSVAVAVGSVVAAWGAGQPRGGLEGRAVWRGGRAGGRMAWHSSDTFGLGMQITSTLQGLHGITPIAWALMRTKEIND